ncbi:MAG: hypothetical protein ACO1OB_27165 [Archangium sp.]
MSDARDAIEQLQARLKTLEASAVPDLHLSVLADSLENEARSYQQVLEKKEKRAEAAESGGQSGRVLAFGFSLLFVTPIVTMIGVSLAKLLRHEKEVSVVILIIGALLILGVFFGPLRHLVAHRASGEWRRVRDAMKEAETLRSLSMRSGERAGERGVTE